MQNVGAEFAVMLPNHALRKTCAFPARFFAA
ncbi:hypothetical protein CGSMWGv55152_05224 [Gardnerella vaginalis 55152]|uniref:Uncharacterized protein n=1 Tax=Gardnerella vaginalis 55152 TaxID=698955 RepID=I4LRD3_GARVA|nr:hypothetical protein CGSMWGv55152_05224 [Gardnerella vaginalis 55152]